MNVERETTGRLKVIPESLLVESNPQLIHPQDTESDSLSAINSNRVISTEDLQQNFQHFITNFNQPLFTKYLMQQQPIIPTVKPKNPVPNYPSSFYTAPLATNSSSNSSVGVSAPISNPTNPNAGPRDFIPFKCPLCSLIYRTQAFLNEHMRKEHSVLI